jgi:predicted DNA-binding antitoxin AbrB/MazE fold protein
MEAIGMSITIDATYEDGVLKPAEPLPLAEHAQVRVTVEEQTAPDASLLQFGEAPAGPSLAEQIVALANSIPDEVVARWPTDGASQHDHYIYGTPKRTDLRDKPE